MDKYGVLHEYRCECGYCIVRRDNEPEPQVIIKVANPIEHVHELKEVIENGRGSNPSTDVRPG
jgi:hypothetical protein